MCLLRRHLRNVGFAQVQGDELITAVPAEFDFDRVHICPPAPIVLLGGQRELLAGLEICDVKGT
jgi:hypothetical protein